MKYKAVAIGCSMGGLAVVSEILRLLPADFSLSIVIVCHLDQDSKSLMAELLNRETVLNVEQCDTGLTLKSSQVYVAPPAYHVYLEPDLSFSFSKDPKVSYCRPSIDVLFESMADVLGPQLIGVLLTGANSDGAQGLCHIKEMGGTAIVQDPKTAEAPIMPRAGITSCKVDHIAS
ncbi:MAG: chemotaxis protein CheB, partial [Alphaproteobacteria bacterium]|nr:chemotaxis protein CheB [Alphaproteobacteria bacterium]